MLTWKDAPKDATHQHSSSKMFYKVEGEVVKVWSAKGGWTKSKVAANSTSLMAKPQEETTMPNQSKVMSFGSLEEVTEFLQGIGVPADEIQQITGSVQTVAVETEETCDCEACKLQAEMEEVSTKGLAITAEAQRLQEEGMHNLPKIMELLSEAAELAQRKVELMQQAAELEAEEEGDNDSDSAKRVAAIDAITDQVVAKVSEVATPRNKEEFRMYAGVTIAALRDMGLLSRED